MTSHDKSGGTPKNSKADSNTPGTSAATRASGEKSKIKGKQPSLLHIDRDLRFRRHMIPKRPPMFAMEGPNRMMAPHPRDTGRVRSSMLRERRPSMLPPRNMFKDSGARMGPPPPGGFMGPMPEHPKEPGMMPGRNMFKDSGARRGPPPPGGFMGPMQSPPKESKDMPQDFIKPPIHGERRVPGGFPQRQDQIPKYAADFPGRTMDYQGKQVEPFRKGPYPMPSQPKQEGFAQYPDRQLGLPDFGMKKSFIPPGKPIGRFPPPPGHFMMGIPPSDKKMMHFPERFMDMSNYSMDFQGRLMNQQGKYVNPLNRAPTQPGRPMMPVPPPIRQRFMQRPERYIDMSRYTMDFEGRYRDNYGRQIDPMEQFNAKVGRYIRSQPPPDGRLGRFPERFMDLSRYTMDFQGRFMDSRGKFVDPLGRFQRKSPVSLPLNQRRFARQPEKYMDMSGYTMDFQGRFRDRRGRHIDLLGKHLSYPGRYMLPSPGIQRGAPASPRRFMGPPLKQMDLSRYSMDFEGRLMDNQGRYVNQMRRPKEPMMPMVPRRLIAPPPKQMDFSRYSMDFEGRLMDNQGRYVDQIRRSKEPMMSVVPRRFGAPPVKQREIPRYPMDLPKRLMDNRSQPVEQMGRPMDQMMPMIPQFAVPPPKQVDMPRYPMDLEGRLMDNQGPSVDQMRRFDEHMMPPPEYNQGNFPMDFPRFPMDMPDHPADEYTTPIDQAEMPPSRPEPNIFFERPSSPEVRPTSVIEKVPPMEPEPITHEKDYSEPKSRRSRSPGEHRVEFQDVPCEESESPTPSEEEALMLMEDEYAQFMKFPMSPTMYSAMRSSIISMQDECFQMPPQMMHFNYEMFMQQPYPDDMMMTEMMNTGYPMYQSMRTSFGTSDSDYMMNEQQWFLNNCPEFMDNERMHKRYSFRMGNEPIQQGHLPALMEYAADEPCQEERRLSQFGDRRSHSMVGDQEFDIRSTRFSHYEDYPAIIQNGYQTPTNGMFGQGDHGDQMFDGGYYPDYYMGGSYPEGFMSGPSMGFMNDFQQPFCFDPEYMGMNPGFMNESGSPYPYPFMGDNYGIGYYDSDEDGDSEQGDDDDEEEEEDMHHRMRNHCERGRTPSPMRGPLHSHRRSPSPRQGENNIEAETQRGMTRPRSFFGDEDQLDDRHARYLEEAAQCLRERGRFLREQHERFLQELENSGPLNHHQIQAEAEAHAQMVEEEVNSTEAEAKAVERLARSARGVANVECVLPDNRYQYVDNQSRYPHKHMDMH